MRMHIQKLLLAMICMSVFAGGLEAQTADSDVQAKARELLRQKEIDLNAATNTPAPATPQAPSPEVVTPAVPPPAARPVPPAQEPAAPPVPQPVPTVAPAVPAVAPVEPAFVYGKRLSPEDEAKLREATRKAIEDLNSQAATATPAAPMPATPGTVVTTPIPGTQPIAVAPYDPKAVADEKAARKEEAKLIAKQEKEAKKEAQMAGTYQPVPPAIPTPAPVYVAPNSKEGRLYDLLQKYNRDEITPADYHQQRAKILAEP